ncbi:MAG: 16S rRNA (guanine(527)-N(7))-methyltransferase RsmG, partial [Solirubrobacterales bacterium]
MNTASGISELATRFALEQAQLARLDRLAQLSVELEISGTAIKSADEARDLHIADSLAGLEVSSIREASQIVDIGSGVGFPGIVLAIALPNAQITLVDSVRKKMEAAAGLVRELGIENVECVWARVEEFAAEGAPAREAFDVVTARALASLTALVEYAAPLLKVGGSLVAWKGVPEAGELADAAAAEAELGFGAGALTPTKPFPGSRSRHFFVSTKLDPTPS